MPFLRHCAGFRKNTINQQKTIFLNQQESILLISGAYDDGTAPPEPICSVTVPASLALPLLQAACL